MPSDRYDVMQSQACINAKHAVIYYTLKNSNVPGFTIHKYRILLHVLSITKQYRYYRDIAIICLIYIY